MTITIVITILATANKAPTPSKKWNQIKIEGFFRIQTHGLCISAAVSTIWAMKTHTLRAGKFVEFILTDERNEI